MFRLQALGLALALVLTAGPARSQELPITSGDKLDVVVTGELTLTRVYTVDQAGNITLDLIGKVPVKDLSPAQVRDLLAKRLAKFIKDPQVGVDFKERAQITVGVTGAVTKGGQVTLPKGALLLGAISKAEGLTVEADTKNVRVQRRGEAAPRLLDLSRILEKDSSLNLELRDGDSIYVPLLPKYLVRVVGAVNKAGEQIYKEKPRLLEAVLAAGGFTEDADRRSVRLLRKGVAESELLNLEGILSGKADNPLLEDGDTVTIPEYRKILVKVFGSVLKAPEKPILVRQGTTVQAAITAAGGFTPDANKRTVTVTSVTGQAKRLNLLEVDSADSNYELEDGAVVRVEALLRVTVMGGVTTPGHYPFSPDGKKVYLNEALGLAGGPVREAKKKTFFVQRKAANGEPLLITCDFERYLKKRTPQDNPELQAGDVVFVPTRPEESRKTGVLETIGNLIGGLAFF